MLEGIRATAKKFIPVAARKWIRSQQLRFNRFPITRSFGPFGQLHRRVKPFRPLFGYGHGQCIDRYYIEKFLAAHESDIQGRVLEVGDNSYTYHYGGAKVVRSDVLHVMPGNPKATIVADLTSADQVISSETFDCIILTQTLDVIYDVRAALRTVHRILKPGGILLATIPGMRHISRFDMENWGEYWRFTSLSASKLFGEVFAPSDVSVRAYGNVLAAVAFLHGVVVHELYPEELEYHDPDYEVLISVRAVRSSYSGHAADLKESRPKSVNGAV